MFKGENSGVDRLESEIVQNAKETKRCEDMLNLITSKSRNRILTCPDLIDEILLEGITLRKQTQIRLDELSAEVYRRHKAQFCPVGKKRVRLECVDTANRQPHFAF